MARLKKWIVILLLIIVECKLITCQSEVNTKLLMVDILVLLKNNYQQQLKKEGLKQNCVSTNKKNPKIN